MFDSMDPAAFKGKTDITVRMGTILTSWLTEVCVRFNVSDTAWKCALSILNRYISKTDIRRSKLQLCGICALMLGSKYCDSDIGLDYFEPGDCRWVCDNAYTIQEVIDMERDILNVLDFQVYPNPI